MTIIKPQQPSTAAVSWAAAQPWWNDTNVETSFTARMYANALNQFRRDRGADLSKAAFYNDIGALVKQRFPELEVLHVPEPTPVAAPAKPAKRKTKAKVVPRKRLAKLKQV